MILQLCCVDLNHQLTYENRLYILSFIFHHLTKKNIIKSCFMDDKHSRRTDENIQVPRNNPSARLRNKGMGKKRFSFMEDFFFDTNFYVYFIRLTQLTGVEGKRQERLKSATLLLFTRRTPISRSIRIFVRFKKLTRCIVRQLEDRLFPKDELIILGTFKSLSSGPIQWRKN